MADELAHLGPSARETVALTPAERIAKIRSRHFTDYPRSRFVLDLLTDQLNRPKGSLKPNLLIWGESGQGKTRIANKHLRDWPGIFDKKTGVRSMPVVG